MARASSDDACMICEQAPCECRKKRATPKARPRPKAVTEPESVAPVTAISTRQSALDKMRARIQKQAQDERFAVPVEEAVSSVGKLSTDDAAMIHAIRILSEAFEIDERDLAPYRKYLDQPPTVQERAALWKRRTR